jgi:hypothetical protein
MISRVHNVVRLSHSYDTAHGLKQLRASISCAREFAKELIQRGQTVEARGLAERIFSFSLRDPAMRLWIEKGIAPFAAVEPHSEFGELFLQRRYPQMCKELDKRYSKKRAAT